MRVAFLSPALPWSFGPYASQLSALAKSLAASGVAADGIVWISMLSRMHNRTYEVNDLYAGLEAPTADHPNLLRRLKGPDGAPVAVTYRGTGVAHCGMGMYTSTLNAIVAEHRVHALISLMDHNRIFVDARLAVRSLAWFPDHFVRLDAHHRHAFAAYSHVVALSPSSASKARLELPYKTVTHIPHAVTRPEGVASRSETRARLGVPADAFLVFVCFANYDAQNRKSVDVSLLAFRSLLDVAPHAKLFIHAVSADHVFRGTSAAKSSPGIDLAAGKRVPGTPRAVPRVARRPRSRP